jgi:hypothetical protein
MKKKIFAVIKIFKEKIFSIWRKKSKKFMKQENFFCC